MKLLRFEVQDTGSGIPESQQGSIFDPFVQGENLTNAKGTGLGLAITRKFVEMLGGHIGLGSASGRGSCFWLEIPLEPAEADEIPDQPAQAQTILGLAPGQSFWRILVAEDDPDSQKLIERLLRLPGIDVRIVKNGEEAVHLFREFHPDLILMDIRMPVMNGLDATRSIRSLSGGASVPILALTASVFTEEQPAILEAGCNDILFKPIHIDQLFAKIVRLIPIQFLYEESPATAHAKPVDPEAACLEAASLPPELREPLIKAALQLDAEAIEGQLPQLAENTPILAEYIERLLQQFDFGQIAHCLKQCCLKT